MTKDSGFSDKIPPFCSIMADKEFNLFDECAGRNITLFSTFNLHDSFDPLYSKFTPSSSVIYQVKF